MPAPDARKPSNQQPHKPTGIETLNEATRRYLYTVVEHADWIGRELGLCLSPSYRPDAVLADNYCKSLRWRLLPTVRAEGQCGVGFVDGCYRVLRPGRGQRGQAALQPGEQIDMEALAGYGVEPISLLSALSRSVLGEDFPRATSWLCRLLDQLPADVWTKDGQPPTASLVEDWRKATEMVRGCLASRLAAPPAAKAETKEQPWADDAPLPQPESRCAPMKKTEIAARILNKTTTKGIRPRKIKAKLEHCGLRDEGNGLYSIRLAPTFLSAEEIERLNTPEWPPPPNVN